MKLNLFNLAKDMEYSGNLNYLTVKVTWGSCVVWRIQHLLVD